MRTIGFVLLLLGGLIIYLSWQNKLGASFNAVFKGTVTTSSGSSGSSSSGSSSSGPNINKLAPPSPTQASYTL